MYILVFKNVILSYIYIQTFTVNWKEKLFKCLNTFSNNARKVSSTLSSQMRSLAFLAFRTCSSSFPAPAYCMGPHPWCYHQKLSWPVSHLAPATPLSSICSLLPPVSPSPYDTHPLHFLLSPKKRAENRSERYSPSETDHLLGEWEGQASWISRKRNENCCHGQSDTTQNWLSWMFLCRWNRPGQCCCTMGLAHWRRPSWRPPREGTTVKKAAHSGVQNFGVLKTPRSKWWLNYSTYDLNTCWITLFPGQLHPAVTFWTCFSIFLYFVLLYLHNPRKKKKVTLT